MHHDARLAAAALLLLLASAPGSSPAQEWKLKISGAGLGNPLAVNPLNEDILYAAVGGDRVYVSRDRGYTWSNYGTQVSGGGIIKSIAVSPLDTQKILVGVESSVGSPDRIMRSTDGGAGWTQTWAGTFSYFGQPVEFSASHPGTVYTMGLDTLYRSSDFGETWDTVRTGTGFNAWCDAALRPDSSGVMYVGDNTSGIWKTVDSGVSWRKVYSTLGEIPSIAIDPFDPRVAYAGKFGGGGGLVKTTDWGETWHPLPVPSGGRDAWWVACSPVHPGYLYYGTYTADTTLRGIYVSGDSGSTWSRINEGLGAGAYFNYGLLALDTLTVLALQSNGLYRFEYPAEIDVLQPDGGEVLLADSAYEVGWTASGVYYVTIEFSADNGGSWTTIADSVPAWEGSLPWTAPPVTSESCLVRVSDALFTPASATSSSVFTVACSLLTVTSPNGGEAWNAGSIREISWTSFGLDTLVIELSTDGGAAWTGLAVAPAEAGALLWTVPDLPTQAALVRTSRAADPAVADTSDGTFTIASPAGFTAGIMVADPGGGTGTLSFGLIPGASDGIDTALGEIELGPRPPAGVFDARWHIDGTNGLGSDYRDTFGVPADMRIYRALVQPGPAGFPVSLEWRPDSLLTGTLVMRDRLTEGDSRSINMRRDSILVVDGPAAADLEVVHCPGTPVTITGDGGWRLVSLPVEIGERRAASLFPFSPTGAYAFVEGYWKRDTLRHGEGYWIRTGQTTLTGCPVPSETCSVRPGWNIVGTPSLAVPAASVVSDPESLAVSPFFGYGPAGYFPADTLLPGWGYWVKCRDSGRLVMSGSPAAQGGAAPGRVMPPAGRLTVERAGWRASTLIFGTGPATVTLDAPPAPPGESAGILFKEGKIGVFHEPYPKYPIEYEIDISGPQSEIFFRWDVEIQENLEYILVENRAGLEIREIVLHGAGSARMTIVPESRLYLRALPGSAGAGATPAGFSVGEWYPNPFNPSTRIKLGLPFESTVSYTVFNVLGERVTTSAIVPLRAGEHFLEWRAVRDDGSPLGSGVYFVVVEAVSPEAGSAGRPATIRTVRKAVLVR